MLLALAAWTLLASTPAAGGPDDPKLSQAKGLFRRGEIAYRLRQFQRALKHFEQALALVNRPSVILNVAQCHRQLGQPKAALFYYKLYRTEWARQNPNRASPYAAEVARRIAELERQLARPPTKKPPAKKPPAKKPPPPKTGLGEGTVDKF